MNEFFLNFARRLTDAIEKSSIDKDSIAKQADITTQTLNSYLRGSQKISLETIVRLSDILRVSVHDLIGPSRKEIELENEVESIKKKMAVMADEMKELKAQLRFASNLITGRTERSRRDADDDVDNRPASSGST